MSIYIYLYCDTSLYALNCEEMFARFATFNPLWLQIRCVDRERDGGREILTHNEIQTNQIARRKTNTHRKTNMSHKCINNECLELNTFCILHFSIIENYACIAHS